MPEGVSRKSLPVSSDDLDSRGDYWVSLSRTEGFEPFQCQHNYNHTLSRDFVHELLVKSCQAANLDIPFSVNRGFARRRIEFTLKHHQEGEEVIWLQSHYLRSARKFGFLIDFRFRQGEGIQFSKRVQQLSLSLDKSGRENRNFYSDRFDKVQYFIERHFDNIFPLSRHKAGSIKVAKKLIQLRADTLEKKRYEFCKGQTHDSQFLGIKRFCPLAELDRVPTLFFVYQERDRLLSLDLYKALRGQQFPKVFPGTKAMFKFPLNSENVKGVTVSDFKEQEMKRVRDVVNSSNNSPALVVLVAPWDEESTEDSQEYFRAKHVFVSAGIPSQVVRLHTLERDSRLQWSTSNIALQCFAKLGGQPWKVQPRHRRCLIIGLGQSHRETFHNGKRRIERYYAYSVLTDSSGLFKELRVLGHSDSSEDYLAQIKQNVKDILIDHSEQFDRYVIHAPYKIRTDELDSIEEVLSATAGNGHNQFVVLRINANNPFFGYSQTNNSLVPFESTYISLARDEYLVWFEGLQYHNPKVSRRYSNPIHIVFHYSNTELTPNDQLDYLQDTVNLSGANWRGFNAKNLPVSTYYAQLIARFTGKFDELDLPELALDNLNPWFL